MPKICRFLPVLLMACSLMPLPVLGIAAGIEKMPEKREAVYTTTAPVNLRDNPEGIADSSVIRPLEVGERVVLIQRGETWCKIRLVSSRESGWALCEYLEENA